MKKIISLLLCFVLLCGFFGCKNGNVPQDNGEFCIATSFYPVMLIAKGVTDGADNVKIMNMTKPQTGCLHDYTLLPGDIKTLEKADVFVINGLGMESFISKVYESLPELKVIDLSQGIEPKDGNAHIWLSPRNTAVMAENLRKELAVLNPGNAAVYEKNTLRFEEELNELDKELKSSLGAYENKSVISFHEAFGCFADAYNINVAAVIEREPGEEPTTGEIKEAVEIIKNTDTKILLTEPQYSPAAAEIIAKETGAKAYEIDPVVTGESDEAYSAYFEKMRNNAKVLREAFENQ